MLAEILAYNKSAFCRSVSAAFSFVLFYTVSNVWLQHLFIKLEIRQEEPVSYIYALRGPLHSNSFSCYLCSPCSLVPLFPCSPVPFFHCSPCFSVSLVPLFLCSPCSPCFRCSSVPLVALFPFFPCYPVRLFPLFPYSLVPLVPMFPLFTLFRFFSCFPVTLFSQRVFSH